MSLIQSFTPLSSSSKRSSFSFLPSSVPISPVSHLRSASPSRSPSFRSPTPSTSFSASSFTTFSTFSSLSPPSPTTDSHPYWNPEHETLRYVTSTRSSTTTKGGKERSWNVPGDEDLVEVLSSAASRPAAQEGESVEQEEVELNAEERRRKWKPHDLTLYPPLNAAWEFERLFSDKKVWWTQEEDTSSEAAADKRKLLNERAWRRLELVSSHLHYASASASA